ncbi:MAG: MFS transporter [Burkholderiales bacterium]|nr:MFS transporter [Burkholderiales bacterium]
MRWQPDPHPATFVGWLSLAQLIGWGSVFYAFSMLLTPVEAELGVTRADVSLAMSLALLAEGLAAYPVGRWIEAGHERLVMTGGSILAGVGLLGLSQTHSLLTYSAAWVVLGVAMAATLYTPAFAVVTRRFPDNFRRQIITITFLGGLASTVFIPLMAWLLTAVGWRPMLWVLAACQLCLCAPIHARLLRHAPRSALAQRTAPSHPASPSRPPGGPAHPVAASPSRVQPSHPHTAYRHALRSPAFALVGVFQVLMMGVTVAIAAHLISLLLESGMDPAWTVALPAAMGVVQVLGRSMLFLFEHKANVHQVNRAIPALMPLGLLALLASLIWFNGNPYVAFVFVALYGLGNGMLTIVKGTSVAQYVSREHAASLNGALGLPTALGRASAPWLLGALWTPAAGYTWGLWVLLATSLVAMAALAGAQRLSTAH